MRLWTVILVATVGDILLTMTGLTVGLQEGNAVVSTMLAERAGWPLAGEVRGVRGLCPAFAPSSRTVFSPSSRSTRW